MFWIVCWLVLFFVKNAEASADGRLFRAGKRSWRKECPRRDTRVRTGKVGGVGGLDQEHGKGEGDSEGLAGRGHGAERTHGAEVAESPEEAAAESDRNVELRRGFGSGVFLQAMA